MYKAKEAGRNSLHFFTQQMHEQVHNRIELEADLRQALPRDQLFLHYQPIVDATTLAVSGVEALLRWKHPGRGMVSPNDFISVAEESGLIVPIGEWVLRTACEQAKAWLDDGLLPGRIAVNVSSRQCRHGSWLEFIEWVLRDSGLPPDLLTIEITESVLLDGMDFRVAMSVLQDMGVHLSIDDFGTGYSSLSYLKQFRADVVKIDRTFVSDVVDDPDSAALTQAIIAMAHGLKLTTVAEGVENVEQVEFLRALGCDYLQGFYFSRPQPADTIEAYFRRNRSAPSEDSQTA
jgi:EAL domain-containing protein (putative c-di-GMP-specific phosphodiesterase class I)